MIMDAIHFELSGRTAFFKKPDVNSFAYFTYNNIHKVALLGMLGAITGMGGYIQQTSAFLQEKTKTGLVSKKNSGPAYPEFYEKLKDLKVSILPPLKDRGYFSKKTQVFNNSVGYASREEGGNLIIQEQWLENPHWDIFILDDNSIDAEVFTKIKDYLLNGKCEYMPYLGKNDHMAVIKNAEIVVLEKVNSNCIHSLFPAENVELGRYTGDGKPKFIFKEIAPVSINMELNIYEYRELILTNSEIANIKSLHDVYTYDGLTLAFI